MAEIHSKKINEHVIDTIIEDDANFVGEAVLDKSATIKGRFKGSIKSSDDLYLDKDAHVNASITTEGSVYIHGDLQGNIDAQHRVELFSGSSTIGDISAGRVVIENDCIFNGSCTMRMKS